MEKTKTSKSSEIKDLGISDILTGVAVLIAFVSLIYGFLIDRRQRRYAKNQDELNRLLIRKEKEAIESDEAANVSADIISLGSSKRYVRVFNKGRRQAQNVRMAFINTPGWDMASGILPIEYLDPGKNIYIQLFLYGHSRPKTRCRVKRNEEGIEKETEVLLTR